jgi:hypothetical protein
MSLHMFTSMVWSDSSSKAYNADVKHGPASKKFIHLDKLQSHTVDANTLISVAHEVYKGLDKKRGRFATCIVSIWHSLHRHAKAIDVFIQSRPELTSLIWGSVRILLQVTEEMTGELHSLSSSTLLTYMYIRSRKRRSGHVASPGKVSWRSYDILGGGSKQRPYQIFSALSLCRKEL